MEQRKYRYVGPSWITQSANHDMPRFRIGCVSELAKCLARLSGPSHPRGSVTATYIIDPQAQLWIADRHSEHYDCAAGDDVLAAGEIVFHRLAGRIAIAEITNQSTGYCPEPECWPIVAQVLDRIGIPHPQHFTSSCEFRRCDACGATNLVKDAIFECAICGTQLNRNWNFA